MTMGDTKGMTVPVRAGMPWLMKIDSSMAATRMTGTVNDLKVSPTITRIASTESTLVTWMSTVVMSIRSLVIAPSPVISAPGSYRLAISFSASIWAFSSSRAAL